MLILGVTVFTDCPDGPQFFFDLVFQHYAPVWNENVCFMSLYIDTMSFILGYCLESQKRFGPLNFVETGKDHEDF